MSEGALLEAQADGAPPEGWRTDTSCSQTSESALYLVRSLPVEVPWPDRSEVHLLLDRGLPVEAFGTERAARRDCATRNMASTGPAFAVVGWPVADNESAALADGATDVQSGSPAA